MKPLSAGAIAPFQNYVMIGSTIVGKKSQRSCSSVAQLVERSAVKRGVREMHAGLQLPQETVVEKSGEFREAFPGFVANSERES
jgi:superfamily II helicase